jgi:hypothetical protein
MSRTIISPVTPSCKAATPVLPAVSLSTLRDVRTVVKVADVAREGFALSLAGRLECSLAFRVASLSRCIRSEVATAVEIQCARQNSLYVLYKLSASTDTTLRCQRRGGNCRHADLRSSIRTYNIRAVTPRAEPAMTDAYSGPI